jgi:hypothetical protein
MKDRFVAAAFADVEQANNFENKTQIRRFSWCIAKDIWTNGTIVVRRKDLRVTAHKSVQCVVSIRTSSS